MLAGISAPYYTRLEQGQSRNASREVLDAVASALRLDESERAHLHALARAPRKSRAVGRPPVERVPPTTSALLAAPTTTPRPPTRRRAHPRGAKTSWNPDYPDYPDYPDGTVRVASSSLSRWAGIPVA
ncbi:transcriptional regulator with XRE-family HTH domain [Streptomyces sp. LBL]|nr:transcriptional regulator with XRE-family HTH domain [Streptomyces sp. LBL]